MGSLRALDIQPDRMTMHGFQAMARTILDEVLGSRPDFIEHQLAHAGQLQMPARKLPGSSRQSLRVLSGFRMSSEACRSL